MGLLPQCVFLKKIEKIDYLFRLLSRLVVSPLENLSRSVLFPPPILPVEDRCIISEGEILIHVLESPCEFA